MRIISQLPVQSHLLPIISKGLNERWPQLNKCTKIEYIKTDFVNISDDPLKHYLDERLRPYHENLRDDIKEEIRKNTGAIINDKNYLMKIADKYSADKIDFMVTRQYNLEIFGFFDELTRTSVSMECFYCSETDTLFVRDK